MNNIKLQPQLLSLVLDGLKRATTRKGLKDYILGPARLINSENKEDILNIYIRKLETIRFKHIDDDLAKIENYECAEDLKSALVGIYGTIDDNEEMTIVDFYLE